MCKLTPPGRVAVLLALMGWMWCGCVSMQASVLEEHGRRLHIPMVKNKTLEYGAEELVTDVLVANFARDPRLDVVEVAPDMILHATLESYRLSGRDFDAERRVQGKFLAVVLVASVVDADDGSVIHPEQTYQSSGVYFADSEPDQRREGDVFLRLSQAMISSIIEGW